MRARDRLRFDMEIRHLHTGEKALREFVEVVGKEGAEREEATIQPASRNASYGMNGIASEVERMQAPIGHLPWLASFRSLRLHTT